jgi:predicted PurR-regulated permease PerM
MSRLVGGRVEVEQLTAGEVNQFMMSIADEGRQAKTQTTATALRSLLAFLHVRSVTWMWCSSATSKSQKQVMQGTPSPFWHAPRAVVLLAAISAATSWVFLSIIGVPYPVPLALWVGVVSQFVPVIGTYLAGAMAVLVALLNDPVDGALTLGFVIVYQQVENYFLAPRISARTMELHPAVAFGTVICGAALLGPVGAVLALPAAAIIQAFGSTLLERYDVPETTLTAEPADRTPWWTRLRRHPRP